MKLKTKKTLTILHLLTGEARTAEGVPFQIGTAIGSDWQLDDETGQGGGAAISINKASTKSGYSLQPISVQGDDSGLFLNGVPFLKQAALPPNRPVTLKFAKDLFAIALVANPNKWLDSIDLHNWMLFNAKANAFLGTAPFNGIGQLIASSGQPFEQCAILPKGLKSSAFWVISLPELMPPPDTPAPTTPAPANPAPTTPAPATHAPVNPKPSKPKPLTLKPSKPKPLSLKSSKPKPVTPAPVTPAPVAPAPIEEPAHAEPVPVGQPQKPISTTHGEHSCPICWQHFDNKDILHVASHPDLRGDELLGANEMRRFIPSQYDEDGHPLDDFGLPAPDMACPHCHQRLPQGFLELPHHIFSMVGAPASGKSYYLAILVQQLKRCLFEKFSLGFGDQDPAYNVKLNDTSNRLFRASTPEEAAINKTQLSGGVYRRVLRAGQEVDLPMPYIFNCSRFDVEGSEKCIVFYDNAGEHFLPQNSTADDFHILHMAKAAGLFFLFDPVSNIEFRRRLRESEDPQMKLKNYESDSQDVILAQMNAKIKRALGIALTGKLDVPLAIMVNKSDIWLELLAEHGELEDPIVEGHLDMGILDRNSEVIHSLMAHLCPAVVANAKKLSSEIRYFAISAFGHSPFIYEDSDTGRKMIAPDPEKIEPQMLEIPTIWVLSKIAPGLIPTR